MCAATGSSPLGGVATNIEGEHRLFVYNGLPNSIAPILSRLLYGVPQWAIQFKTERAQPAGFRIGAAALNPGD